MIISIKNDVDVDTDVLSSEERHILQKLLCWKVIDASLDQFREHTERAFLIGWSNSGPVRISETMTKVICQFERELLTRLNEVRDEKKE